VIIYFILSNNIRRQCFHWKSMERWNIS